MNLNCIKKIINTFHFSGSIIFNEDLTVDETKKQYYERNRKEAYLGSRMHFFRSLWENNLFYERIYNSKIQHNNPLNYNTIVFQKDSLTKVLKYPIEPENWVYAMIHFSSKLLFISIMGRFPLRKPDILILWMSGGIGMARWEDSVLRTGCHMNIQSIIQMASITMKLINQKIPRQLELVFRMSLEHQIIISDLDKTSSIDSLRIIEKVYIHTDRSCYYPGDDIWFKAYLIDASDRSLSNHSGNLHVELISPDSKIIINKVIRLEAGLGNGDFKLPDTLNSGRYRIRAYTNYMRNFNDHLFFNKEIVIVNSTDTGEEIPDEIKYVKDRIELSFFPEGGSLVDNVISLVAFKAVNGLGKGCDVSGEIYCSTGELITTFKSTHLGMGSFYLRPVPGLSYYSVVKDSNGTEIRSEIPKSFMTGVTLSASINGNNELLITTRTNPQTLALVQDHDLLLSFSARKVTLKTISFKIRSYNNTFILPVDDLPDGIVMMTLSTPEELPLSERLIYIQRDTDFRVNIEPDKPVYKQRDSVELMISFTNGSVTPQEAYLSLSAVEKSFTDNTSPYPSTISSWFLLESDVRGPIEEPSYYFDPTNHDRIRDLDLLLLTQGWRDFEWKYNKTKYPPEIGFTVSGRLRREIVNKPLEASMVNIGIFENKSSLVTTIPVDSSGRFRLDGIDFTGEARLIVSAVGKKGDLQGLVLLDSLKYTPAEVSDSLPRLMILPEENVTTFKQEYEIKETIRKKYKLSDTISLGEVNIIARKDREYSVS